jgi:hypothetical protein
VVDHAAVYRVVVAREAVGGLMLADRRHVSAPLLSQVGPHMSGCFQPSTSSFADLARK